MLLPPVFRHRHEVRRTTIATGDSTNEIAHLAPQEPFHGARIRCNHVNFDIARVMPLPVVPQLLKVADNLSNLVTVLRSLAGASNNAMAASSSVRSWSN
jgi:hypothetical protein